MDVNQLRLPSHDCTTFKPDTSNSQTCGDTDPNRPVPDWSVIDKELRRRGVIRCRVLPDHHGGPPPGGASQKSLTQTWSTDWIQSLDAIKQDTRLGRRFTIEGSGSKQSAAQFALQKLRESILTGVLLPGGRLVQEQLADMLGVSRVPIREALRTLESEGLVTHVRSAGYSVAKVDADTLHRIQRLRCLLEADSIQQAAQLGALGPGLSAELADLHREIRALPTEDADRMARMIRGFHFRVFESSEDPILLRFLGNLWDATDSWRTIYYRTAFISDTRHREDVFARHERLIDAVAGGDTVGVIAILNSLRDEGIAIVEKAVRSLKEDNQWQAQRMLRALDS